MLTLEAWKWIFWNFETKKLWKFQIYENNKWHLVLKFEIQNKIATSGVQNCNSWEQKYHEASLDSVIFDSNQFVMKKSDFYGRFMRIDPFWKIYRLFFTLTIHILSLILIKKKTIHTHKYLTIFSRTCPTCTHTYVNP